ncbi:MAG: S41 family peptidase [Bacteroidota bacterium]
MECVQQMNFSTNYYIALLNLLFILTGCGWGKFAHFSPDKKYPAHVVLEDIQSAERLLKKYHPSLYWYADSISIAKAFEKARLSVKDSMTEPSIRNIINEAVSVLHCGHTSVRHSKTYSRYLTWKPASGFPLGVKITDDSTLVVVTNFNARDSLITRGTVIHDINGRSSKNIIDSLFPLVPVDGYSKNFSHQLLTNNFGRFYNSRFPYDSVYYIKFTDSSGKINTVKRTYYNRLSDTAKLVMSFRSAKKIKPPGKLVKKEMVRSFLMDTVNNTAFLRLNTFSNDISKKYIRRQFKKLRDNHIDYLTLDLRNNGGGLVSRSLLLAKLIHQKPFRYIDSVITPLKKLKSPDPSEGRITKRFWINIAMKLLNKKHNHLYHFQLFAGKNFKPHRKGFTGKVYILTGGFSFSATSMFLASVKGLPNVVIVGEESGGAAYGNNGIFIPDVILPHTHLRLRLPLYRIINNHLLPDNGRGVMPDVEVKADAASIRLNKDVKVIKAEDLIKEDIQNKAKSVNP